MSTARFVPETWHLDGDDPWGAARRTGFRRLGVAAFTRLRAADGTSHGRSMAFLVALIAVQGLIALVGLSSLFTGAGVARAARRLVETAAPGPVGNALNVAIDQARQAGQSGRWLAIGLGSVGSLTTGTVVMGQVQRSLNRVYGIERDRPTREKYRLAFGLAFTAGVLLAVAFAAVALGGVIGEALDGTVLATVWAAARIPLGLFLVLAAMAVLLRTCPLRHQPGWRWLSFGAAIAVIMWIASTVLLEVAFTFTSSFGDLYGPLAGMVALLIWAMLSSYGLVYGVAVSAELELLRSERASASFRR